MSQARIPKASNLYERAQGNISDITTRDLAESIKTGDAFAMDEIEHVARALGVGLANVLCLTSVERIAIGGGVAKIGDPLIGLVQKYTAQYVFTSNQGRYKIQQSELGDDVVLIGAILLAKQQMRCTTSYL